MNTLSDTADVTSEPARLFHLATTGGFAPVEGDALDFPDRVSDLPAFYYWKDAIAVGSYVQPARRLSLDITRDRLDGYVSNISRMRDNGVGVPILMDHSATASATLGWIVDVKRDGDRLLELHQFLGESARDIGLRNKVSLGIDPHFIDGTGFEYGEAIVHSAITPVPVVPDQGEFIAMSSAVSSLINDTILELKTQPKAASGEPVAPPVLSFGVHSPEFSAALQALEQVAMVKLDLALSSGGVNPAVADELFNLLARPGNLLMLSRTPSGLPIALAVFDALAKNRPVPLGELTGVQVLARNIPGEDGTLDDLRERMIALASGKNAG